MYEVYSIMLKKYLGYTTVFPPLNVRGGRFSIAARSHSKIPKYGTKQ